MTSKIVGNPGNLSIDQSQKHLTRNDLSDHSVHSFFSTSKPFKSNFEASFMIDQENAKQLQKIQNRAQQLREKEKRERNLLKKLGKVYEEKLKQFQQLQKVTKKALEQKQRQLEMASMENNQLKQQTIQLSTLKDENRLLSIKNQQLKSQTKRLSQQLEALQQNFSNLKLKSQLQAESLDKRIKENHIESDSTAFALKESIQEVKDLSSELQGQDKKEMEISIKKDNQNLKVQTEEIKSGNIMLESLLEQIKKSGQGLQDEIIKGQHKLMGVTNELLRKNQQLSMAMGISQKLEKDLKDRQSQISFLKGQIQKLKQICDSKQVQIQNRKQQFEIFEDSERMRFATESENKQKTIKNFQKFQEKLHNLISDKKLKQYSSVFDVFSQIVAETFKAWHSSVISGTNTCEKFIQTMMMVIENGLININDYFRQKSSLDVERVQKMVGFIHNANSLLQKRNQDEDYIEKDEDGDIDIESTPERFLNKQTTLKSHNREISESSAKSTKRSILLEQDIQDAVVDQDEMHRLKQQSLQEELSKIKNSQLIFDSLNEGGDKADNIKDFLSQSSFSKSIESEMSPAERNRIYNQDKKTTLFKAKLRKKKAQKPQNQFL